jgi:hypothetical protein
MWSGRCLIPLPTRASSCWRRSLAKSQALLNSIALLESQFTKYNGAQRLENTTLIVIMQDGVLAQQTEKGNMLRSSMRCW